SSSVSSPEYFVAWHCARVFRRSWEARAICERDTGLMKPRSARWSRKLFEREGRALVIKRLFDVAVAATGLIVAAPLLLPLMYLIYRQDGRSPFYIAPRVGLSGRLFRMVKLRSMVANADKTGVDSTGASDRRITPVGRFVRR